MEIFKSNSGVYHVRFLAKDGMTTRSTKERDFERAKAVVKEARIREIEMAAKAGALNAEALTAIQAGKKLRAREAFAEWIDALNKSDCSANTIANYSSVVAQWMRELGAEDWVIAKALKADNTRSFINTGGRSNREYRAKALRRFSRFCFTRAYVVGDPVAEVEVRIKGLTHEQKEGRKRVPVTPDDYKKLMTVADGFHRFAVALSYWTGLRLVDICCLEWASIDNESITLWMQKTGKRIEIPLSEPLIGGSELQGFIFEMTMFSSHKVYCFPGQRDTILDPKARAKLSVQFGRLFAKAGVKGKTFHCLRHAFATRLREAGKTVEQIGKLVGHADAATTERYIHVGQP